MWPNWGSSRTLQIWNQSGSLRQRREIYSGLFGRSLSTKMTSKPWRLQLFVNHIIIYIYVYVYICLCIYMFMYIYIYIFRYCTVPYRHPTISWQSSVFFSYDVQVETPLLMLCSLAQVFKTALWRGVLRMTRPFWVLWRVLPQTLKEFYVRYLVLFQLMLLSCSSQHNNT